MTAGVCINMMTVLLLRKRIVFLYYPHFFFPHPLLLSLYKFNLPVSSPALLLEWMTCLCPSGAMPQFPAPKPTHKDIGPEYIVSHFHIPISYHYVYLVWLLCS